MAVFAVEKAAASAAAAASSSVQCRRRGHTIGRRRWLTVVHERRCQQREEKDPMAGVCLPLCLPPITDRLCVCLRLSACHFYVHVFVSVSVHQCLCLFALFLCV